MSLDIMVVGVDHELQNPNPSGFPRDVSEVETLDRSRFRQLLKKLVHDRSVSLIAEEQVSPRETVPHQIAHELGIGHEYVEMSVEERTRRKIPEDYSKNPSLSAAQIQAYHREREAYWVDR